MKKKKEVKMGFNKPNDPEAKTKLMEKLVRDFKNVIKLTKDFIKSIFKKMKVYEKK